MLPIATALRRASCALLLTVLLLPAAHAQQATLDPGLTQALDGLAPGGDLVVIVTFDAPALTTAHLDAVAGLGITQGITLPAFGMMGVVATAPQIEALAARPDVRSLWLNEPVTWYNETSTAITGVDDAQADPDFIARNGNVPLTGKGVAVVINDTGVDGTHPDIHYPEHLIENVQATLNPRGVSDLLPAYYVKGVPNTDVLGGHGTHVAGTVGGNGSASGGRYAGAAPGAALIGYGSGVAIAILDTIGGLYFCLTHQYTYADPIRIVSNSWGPLGGGTFSPDNPVNVATKRLYDAGIVSVFAGGNDGPGAGTLTPYAAPWVLTVAAGNKDGATLADFSSRGVAGDSLAFTTADGKAWTFHNAPTITAPGVDVVSTRNIADAPSDAEVFYTTKSGTSMATPHVSGIIALMLEADPMLPFEDIRRLLVDTATPMAYAAWEAGAGYVNAYAAVAGALGLDPTPYLRTPDGTLADGVLLEDPEGDAGLAGADLTLVTADEDSAGLVLTLHVADLPDATPSTLLAAGLQVGAMQEYSVGFNLDKPDAEAVTYTLSAKRTLVSILGGSAVGLQEPDFGFGVKAANGSGRGIGDLEGLWDDDAGTITWFVPRAALNVATPPADLTATIDRSGRPAADGDRLASASALVATSFWGGVVGLTPGATRYDEGAGTGTFTLGAPSSGGDGDGGDGETDPQTDPTTSHDRPVKPYLGCVAENADGSRTAYFAYWNRNGFDVTIPVGPSNAFTPAPEDRGQPTTFGYLDGFRVDYPGGDLTWTLDGRTVEARLKQRTCRTADLALALTGPDASPRPDETFTVTLTATNAGPDKARVGVISMPLPQGLILESATATHGWFDASAQKWYVGMKEEGVETLTLTLRSPASARYGFEAQGATYRSHDPDAGNNTAALEVVVSDPQPRAVVAVIDSGINPYHDFFHAGSRIYTDEAPGAVNQEVLDAFGVDEAHIFDLTRTGDYAADYAADAARWAAVQAGEVYWFRGTNVLAVSFDAGTRIIQPDDEDDTHGVSTAAAVLQANPEAVVLFVEGITDAAETFAFTHPAVDIVSTSYGPIGSLPLPGHVNDSFTGVVEQGKLHFGAADNSPSTAIQDGTAGPWWSIGINGFEEGSSEGRQVTSGSLADFAGDFSQDLPGCALCEDGTGMQYGTSFATPRSAGTASKVLLEARRALGHLGGIANADGAPALVATDAATITNWQLRRALEEAAYYPATEDYDPVDGVFDIVAVPVPPAGPYAVIGWGVLTPDPAHGVVTASLAQLGVSGNTSRTKDADACTFMTGLMEARHAYWDVANVGSQSWLATHGDPYVGCSDLPGARLGEAGLTMDAVQEVPGSFALAQNYPNPFNPTTTIAYDLPEAATVRLEVYDVVGRRVKVLVDASLAAGRHEVTWDGRDAAGTRVASGLYFYRIEAGSFRAVQQMVLLK